MSLWIWLLLPLIDLISEKCHTKFGGNWTTSKRETEGDGWHDIITKYPILNRIKNEQNSLRVLPKHVHILNAIYSLKASSLSTESLCYEALVDKHIRYWAQQWPMYFEYLLYLQSPAKSIHSKGHLKHYYMTNSYRPSIKKFDWFKAGL